MRKSLVNSTFLGKQLKELWVKLRVRGRSDVQSSMQSAPAGIDSRPVKDMLTIQAATGVEGETVVVGYIHKDMLAKEGETHIFATDAQGEEKIRFKLLQDGTAELAGNANNLVRYAPLNSGLKSQLTAINAELVKIAAGLNAIVPSSYVHTPVTLDISQAKIDELKSS